MYYYDILTVEKYIHFIIINILYPIPYDPYSFIMVLIVHLNLLYICIIYFNAFIQMYINSSLTTIPIILSILPYLF